MVARGGKRKRNKTKTNNSSTTTKKTAEGAHKGRAKEAKVAVALLFAFLVTSFLHCSVHLQVFQRFHSVPPTEFCAFQVRKSVSLASFLRCGPPTAPGKRR
jgi:hypothetical protein